MNLLPLILVLTGPPAILANGGVELPAPTGPHPVGTTSWVVTDKSRAETFGPAGSLRQVPVVAWYPAAAVDTGTPAPYLRAGPEEARSFATLIRKPGAFDDVAGIQTHSFLNAAPAVSPAKFPVLVFSHGYTAIPSSYTALLEDLASHGYVVLSVIHPYEASAAAVSDGRIVTLLDADGALRQEVAGVLSEWDHEDEAMKAVSAADSDKDKLKLLRDYLSGLRATARVLIRWVADTKLVLDRLASLPRAEMSGQLAARLDMTQVGVFGHSMGGVVAGEFCLQDPRCQAGLNLDGIPQYGGMIDGRLKRPFLMVYSSRPGRTGASDPIYAKAASPYYRVDVKNTLHLDFSDMPFWPGGGLRERGAYGSLSPSRATMITRTVVREYFDHTLLKHPSPLLKGEAMFPDVVVQETGRER